MKQCCHKYIQKIEPKRPQDADVFTEDHICPKCGQKLRITFKRLDFLGGLVEYVVVRADLI